MGLQQHLGFLGKIFKDKGYNCGNVLNDDEVVASIVHLAPYAAFIS